MFVIHAEHQVPNYAEWKANGFDADPLGRQSSGVINYRIMRPSIDPNHVVIDLTFETREEAEAMLVRLQALWERVKERFEWRELPDGKILEVTEEKTY